MVEAVADGRGSASWVRASLLALGSGADWAERPECRELVDWLYVVVRHRARRAGIAVEECDEVTQDAMMRVARALTATRGSYAESDNPAAVLERVAARAVGESRHRVSMCGLGGMAANGRNWRARFPRKIGGEAARLIFEALPVVVCVEDTAVTDAAARIRDWITAEIGVRLNRSGMDALVYVMDRLVAGVSRSTLLRGGRSALGVDPAMQHLGFESEAASAFGVWLLGRGDAHHNAPSVLDAALDDRQVDQLTAERWRRDAVRHGFAEMPGTGDRTVAGQCDRRTA